MARAGEETQITIRGMVGARTNEAMVMFRLGEEFVNIPPAKAREVGLMLIEAAESAEQDLGLVTYLRANAFSEAQVAMFLKCVREAREE